MGSKMLPYRYGLLKPQRAPGAKQHNTAWLGPETLGIEVTEAELAGSCALGNIDPQHLGGDQNTAAIEAALSWPPPAPGATLVTLRPDADAVGAMALLSLRVKGVALTQEARERIGLVGRSDCFDCGPWPGPRPLPTRIEDIDEVGLGPHRLGAMIAGLALRETSFDADVQRMSHWICTGEAPTPWIAHAEKAAEALLAALNQRAVVVLDGIPERIAIVRGFAPGALRLGYRRAPVVVAVATLRSGTDDAPLCKITIAQFGIGFANLERAARLLSADEPGWGGSSTIIGSPQGSSCCTSTGRCIDVLYNYCM